jgi:hypothetical protein
LLIPHPLFWQVLVHHLKTATDQNLLPQRENMTMKRNYAVPVIASVLLVSGGLIAGLASADMASDHKSRSIMHAKKLDTNEDGVISLDELTARQDKRFAKLDSNGNGTIDKIEYNARLIAMFNRMDQNGDGMLSEDEMPGHHRGSKRHHNGDDHHHSKHYDNS